MMIFAQANVELTPQNKRNLVDHRDHLIMVMLKKEYTPAEISFIFNRSKQSMNAIIKKIKKQKNG